MLTVCVLLLVAESFYGSSTEEQGGIKVSINNMGASHTFIKRSERVLSSSSNVDVKRALQEVNRRASNKYRLEHVQGHQDGTKRFNNLSLEAQMNAEYNGMVKGAVKRSMTVIQERKNNSCRQKTRASL